MNISGQPQEKKDMQPEQRSSQEPQVTPAAEDQSVIAATSTSTRKKRAKRMVSEAELMPRPSFWPIALAASLAIALFGFVWNAVVLAVGVLLVIVCIIGWSLERR